MKGGRFCRGGGFTITLIMAAHCAKPGPPGRLPPPSPAPGTTADPGLWSALHYPESPPYDGRPELSRYVTQIGERILQAARSIQPDLEAEIAIVDDWSVNAYAHPRHGEIQITRGLLATRNSEDEVAGDLAHELGHLIVHRAFTAETAAGGTSKLELARRHEQELVEQLAVRITQDAGYKDGAVASGRWWNATDHVYCGADAKSREGLTAANLALLGLGLRLAHPDPDTDQREDAHLRAIEGLVVGETPPPAVHAAGRVLLPSAGLSLALPTGWSPKENRPAAHGRDARGGNPDFYPVFVASNPRHGLRLDLGRARGQGANLDILMQAARTWPHRDVMVAGRGGLLVELAFGYEMGLSERDHGSTWLLLATPAGELVVLVVTGYDDFETTPAQRDAALVELIAGFRRVPLPPPPLRLTIRELEEDVTLAELAATDCGVGGRDDLSLLSCINAKSPESLLRAGDLVKCLRREPPVVDRYP